MWYVMEAEPGARMITGFNRKTDRETYLGLLEKKRLKEILNYEDVAAGDVFNIPAGRVHAMGPGILIAEIQQTSDTTYRIYDWDRTDAQGNSRELHTAEALDAIDFGFHESYRTRYKAEPNSTSFIIHTPRFNTNIISFEQPLLKAYGLLDSFVIHLCIEGAYRMEYDGGALPVKKGEAVLIPAVIDDIRIIPEGATRVLEVFIL